MLFISILPGQRLPGDIAAPAATPAVPASVAHQEPDSRPTP